MAQTKPVSFMEYFSIQVDKDNSKNISQLVKELQSCIEFIDRRIPSMRWDAPSAPSRILFESITEISLFAREMEKIEIAKKDKAIDEQGSE
jgi:hypothetical protein